MGVISERMTKGLTFVLMAFILFASIQGMMSDNNTTMQAVQTGSQTPSEKVELEEEDRCPDMEEPAGVTPPVDGTEFGAVSSMLGEVVTASELERDNLVVALELFQSRLEEHFNEKDVPECILEKFSDEFKSALLLFKNEIIERHQLSTEIGNILNSLGRKIYFGIPPRLLTEIGAGEELVQKFIDREVKGMDVEITEEELVGAAESMYEAASGNN